MTTTDFTAFLPEVLPYVHDCPQIAAIQAIRNAAIEFCEKSHYWQVDLASADIDAGTGAYRVSVPDQTVLVDLISGWYNNYRLIPKSVDALSRLYRGTDWRLATGDPIYVTKLDGATLTLVPTPISSRFEAMGLRVALAPSRTATAIATDLFDHFAEVIAKGARARLYATPGQPYYDMNMSMAYHREFLVGIGEAKIKANKGVTGTAVSVEYYPFA